MEEILKLDQVAHYAELLGQEAQHPQVAVFDLSKSPPMRHSRQRLGFYAIFLKDAKCGDLRYGRSHYDYQEGTLVFLAPGQIVGVEDNGEVFRPRGRALLFHPDLLRGTPLGRDIAQYTFFSYESNEALHLSDRERRRIVDLLDDIRAELSGAADRHSRRIVVSNIGLLLNYSARFYERQFVTRSGANRDVLAGFERLLNDYYLGDRPLAEGVPSVGSCAAQLHLSANYFGDLVKRETGMSAQEYIRAKIVEIAKERIFDTSLSIAEIAYGLGFKYPQHFTRLFRREVGCSPKAYRQANS